jgi:hypothetical protein
VSVDPKLDLARGWRSAMRLREDEADRLAELSDDDFERAMADMPAPSRVPTIDELVAEGRHASSDDRKGNVAVQAVDAAIDRGGPSPFVWVLAAAFLLALGVGLVERGAVVAFFKGGPKEPAPAPTAPPGPTPAERGEAIRLDAAKACDQGEWLWCSERLDEAQRIDPRGESAPGVRLLRKKVLDGVRRDPSNDEKPQKVK